MRSLFFISAGLEMPALVSVEIKSFSYSAIAEGFQESVQGKKYGKVWPYKEYGHSVLGPGVYFRRPGRIGDYCQYRRLPYQGRPALV
jgi:hypothetical protein